MIVPTVPVRMLASVDDGVRDILEILEEHRQLDNTLIVFASVDLDGMDELYDLGRSIRADERHH